MNMADYLALVLYDEVPRGIKTVHCFHFVFCNMDRIDVNFNEF